jgi:hypothetical protein
MHDLPKLMSSHCNKVSFCGVSATVAHCLPTDTAAVETLVRRVLTGDVPQASWRTGDNQFGIAGRSHLWRIATAWHSATSKRHHRDG